jgi:hypothetical protein
MMLVEFQANTIDYAVLEEEQNRECLVLEGHAIFAVVLPRLNWQHQRQALELHPE